MLGGDIAVEDAPAGSRLDQAIAATRSGWSGLDDLPVDEPDLETDDAPGAPEAVPLAEELGRAPAAPDPSAPGAPDLTGLYQELALLRSELQASRAAPVPTPRLAAPAPVVPPEDAITKSSKRFRETFGTIEGMEAGTEEYEDARARAFAQTIVQSVVEDILPGDAVQAHIRGEAERIATQKVQEFYAQQEQSRQLEASSAQVVELAVKAARDAGYDVHPPGSAAHAQSRDSVTFWALGQSLSQPGRTAEVEIHETLKWMPPKAAAVPGAGARPTRPQPMGRQGTGAPGVAPGPAAGEPYQAQTLQSILGAQQHIQRIGAS